MPMVPFMNRGYGGGGVPDTFAPDVAQGETPLSPAASPWVRPMRNSAPGELQQTGATLERAGGTLTQLGNTIGDRVQETMDDAQTKAAETQFLQASLPALAQYRTTEGINATQQFDPTAQAISKARQDARTTLTNPIQQRMFDMATNDHMLTFGQQMAEHENVQRVQYGKDQAKSRAQSLNAMSSLDVAGRNRDDSDFARYGAQSDAEVLHYAQLSGIAPDSPQADQMLRQNRTQRYQSVITGLLDQHAYNEAQDFFNAHKPEMDVRAAETLGNAVTTAAKSEQVTEFRDRAVQSLQKTPGAGPLTAPIPGGTISTTEGENGIDIHAATGTKVLAPASGTVTKVSDSPETGLTATITLPSGYTATFSGLGAVNYKEGQRITAGQVLALSGKDDSGNAVTHYAMQDGSGAFVDPRQASTSPFDPRNFSSPDDEEKAVAWVNQNVTDPVQRREAESQVRMLANTNRRIDDQEHAAAVKQATDWWFDHGQSLDGLPAATRMQLTPDDLNSFQQQTKAKNDVNLLANWVEHPEEQTVDAVRQAYAQGRLSDSAYLTALRQATAMQADTGHADPRKTLAVTLDMHQLESTLMNNGYGGWIGKGASQGEKDAYIQLQTHVRDVIDNQQQQTGKKLTRDQVQGIMDQAVMDQVHIGQPGKNNANGGMQFSWLVNPQQRGNAYVTLRNGQRVNPSYIPAPVLKRISGDLENAGAPTTEFNIATRWDQLGRPVR